MRRTLWHFSSALLLVLLSPTLPAAITQIGSADSWPVGLDIEFTIYNSLTADMYSGQWRCLACDPPGDWDPDPAMTQGDAAFTQTFNNVGDYEFNGGAHEQTDPGDAEHPPQYTWSYLTKQVTVVGPDWDTVSTPLDSQDPEEGSNYMFMDVLFYLKSGSFTIGPNVTGDAQERIWRSALYGGNGQWTQWGGPQAGAFELIGEAIYDLKAYQIVNQSAWDAIPNGTVFDEFDQQNRVILLDCAGAPQTYTFPMHHFQREKLDANTWRLSEVSQ